MEHGPRGPYFGRPEEAGCFLKAGNAALGHRASVARERQALSFCKAQAWRKPKVRINPEKGVTQGKHHLLLVPSTAHSFTQTLIPYLLSGS